MGRKKSQSPSRFQDLINSISSLNGKGGGSRKRQKQNWTKRPMATPEIILEILDKDSREDALLPLQMFYYKRRGSKS